VKPASGFKQEHTAAGEVNHWGHRKIWARATRYNPEKKSGIQNTEGYLAMGRVI